MLLLPGLPRRCCSGRPAFDAGPPVPTPLSNGGVIEVQLKCGSTIHWLPSPLPALQVIDGQVCFRSSVRSAVQASLFGACVCTAVQLAIMLLLSTSAPACAARVQASVYHLLLWSVGILVVLCCCCCCRRRCCCCCCPAYRLTPSTKLHTAGGVQRAGAAARVCVHPPGELLLQLIEAWLPELQ